SAENRRQFWIPEGFAHGFAVLSDRAVFSYLCTDVYVKEADAGVRWNDAAIGVDWPVAEPVLSAKDANAPFLADIPVDRLPVYAPCPGSCSSAARASSGASCVAALSHWARSWPRHAMGACTMAAAPSPRTWTSRSDWPP